MSTAPKDFSFSGVLTEAQRIFRSNSHHFSLLSLLLFPFCITIIVFPSFFRFSGLLLSDPTETLTRPVFFTFIFTLLGVLAFFLSPCAIGTTTYSALNGFYGRPVTIASSIKSLAHSFLPLLSTQFVYQTIVSSIVFGYGILAAILLGGFQFLGIEVNPDSIHFWVLAILISLPLFAVILYISVNWCLAYVIVVVESKWGYEALRRSSELVKEMRGITLSISLYYGLLISAILFLNSMLAVSFGVGKGSWHLDWLEVDMVVWLVISSYLTAHVMLLSVAINVVLYIYCKSMNGEEEEEALFQMTADKCVSLPFV